MDNKGKIRLLLVEDETDLAGIISDTLSEKGFEVRCVGNGADGLRAVTDFRPEIVVTDIMMPVMDGYTFVRKLRESGSAVPVLFLSARSDAEDVVRGFELGAGDYIRKPFAISELIVRIHSLLGHRHPETDPMQTGLPVTLGRFTFDPAAGTLSMNGNSTVLPSREAALLFLLSSHIGETVPNPIILKNIWNDDDYFTTRSLNVHITRLRKRLAADPSVSITSIRGIGYRLTAICKELRQHGGR